MEYGGKDDAMTAEVSERAGCGPTESGGGLLANGDGLPVAEAALLFVLLVFRRAGAG